MHASRWIRVEDGVPEMGRLVLIYGRPLGSRVGYDLGWRDPSSSQNPDHHLFSSGDGLYLRGEVTHWLPLPSPPQIPDTIANQDT